MHELRWVPASTASSFGVITVALPGDGQCRDADNRIATEHAADADNHRCPAVQDQHGASVRIGVTRFMGQVIRDRGIVVFPELCEVRTPWLADMLDPLLEDLVSGPR